PAIFSIIVALRSLRPPSLFIPSSFFFSPSFSSFFFFFNDPATPEIYTLSLHDALPILLSFNSATSPLASTWIDRVKSPLVTAVRSEEHTFELQSLTNLVCRLLLEKKKNNKTRHT